jgi:hypothetical protein
MEVTDPAFQVSLVEGAGEEEEARAAVQDDDRQHDNEA